MVIFDVEILRAACCVAGLDKEICEREMPALQKLAERAGVGAASLAVMCERATTDPNFYKQQFGYVHADPEKAIATMLMVAASNGEIEFDQRVMIGHFAEKLGVSAARYERLIDAVVKRTGVGLG